MPEYGSSVVARNDEDHEAVSVVFWKLGGSRGPTLGLMSEKLGAVGAILVPPFPHRGCRNNVTWGNAMIDGTISKCKNSTFLVYLFNRVGTGQLMRLTCSAFLPYFVELRELQATGNCVSSVLICMWDSSFRGIWVGTRDVLGITKLSSPPTNRALGRGLANVSPKHLSRI
jgi:hypothetical protein